MKKRLVSVILAGMMTLGLAGCKSSTETKETQGSTTTEQGTTAGETKKIEKYGKETIKIGFINYDPTAAQFIQMQKYFDYLKEYVNVEFIYSEAIKSAEEELAFIESAASAGAKAIYGYYNVSGKAAVQKTVDLGMFFYGKAEDPDIYNTFKDNKLYLGGVNSDGSDYTAGYAMAKGLIDSGAKKLLLASGGKAFGVPIFVERVRGIEDAIKEANKAGNDVKIVKEINGFPDEAFFSAQAEALAMDVDGVLATFNGAEIWSQPIATAGKAGQIKIATTASIDDVYKAAFEDGSVATLAAELVDNLAMVVPFVVNAVDGNLDAIRNSDGTAANVKAPNIVINDKDTFMKYYNIEATGIWAYSGEDVLKLIKGYNKDAKLDDYKALVEANDIETINARRGVK